MRGLLGDPQGMWNSAGYTYKFYAISSLIIFMLSLIFGNVGIFFFDSLQWTFYKFQLWKLLVSFYHQIPSFLSILSVLFSFLWIRKHFNEQDKSSVYIFWEIIIINFQVHLLLNIISLLLVPIFGGSQNGPFFGYGWFPIILVYEFRQSIIDPQNTRQFCFFPCLIKNKYFPYVIFIIFLLLSLQPLCLIAAAIIGYIQQIVKKSMLIKLPFRFYQFFQKILPNVITSASSFVPIKNVETVVRIHSFRGGYINSPNLNRQIKDRRNNNMNAGQNSEPPAQSKQKVSKFPSGGVRIDNNNNQLDYRSYWKFKDEQKKSDNDGFQQIEVQPQIGNPDKNSKNKNGYQNFQDSFQNNQSSKIQDIQSNLLKNQQENKKQSPNDLI